MFDPLLYTFLCVAEKGSFSAAAKQLFLTPNAIKKRIETLEKQTGLLLFQRNNQGSYLTPAGLSFQRDLQELNQKYTTAVAKATYIQNQSKQILFIGFMSTFAESFMTNRWFDVRQKLRSQQLQMVYYGSSPSDFQALFSEVGTTTILCVDIYDEELARRYNLCARKISSFPLYIGLPIDSALSLPQAITPKNFALPQIAMLSRGRSRTFDALRTEWETLPSAPKIVDLEEYTVRSINECYMQQIPILVPENQIAHCPFYQFYPLQESAAVEFGVYYRKNDEKHLTEFLQMLLPD